MVSNVPYTQMSFLTLRATLVIGESKSPRTELLLQDAVLLDEVVDHVGLVPVDPAGECGEEQPKREEVRHQMR